MIIKSLSRKKASYKQLLHYIEKSAHPDFEIRYNVPFQGGLDELCQHFESLAAQLPARKNGNRLYHEILSLSRIEGVELELQQQALYALCQKYIQYRAPDHAVFGKLHLEGHHLHAHLVISPNTLDAPEKRVRVPKSAYAEIQRQLEAWMLASYPEIRQGKVYTHEGPRYRKRTEKEAQMEQRTGKLSKKAQLRLFLEALLSQAESPAAFAEQLQHYGLQFYLRGDKPGLIAENRRYRLSTLGLETQYVELSQRAENPQAQAPRQQATPAQEPSQATPEDYAARRKQLAAEHVATTLRELFQYSPDQQEFLKGLNHYGIQLEERADGIWCVHEGFEAPLLSMGLEQDYQAHRHKLNPQTTPSEPQAEAKSKSEPSEQERVASKIRERMQALEQLQQPEDYQPEYGPEP